MNAECLDKLGLLINGIIFFTPTELEELQECARILANIETPTVGERVLSKVFAAAAKGVHFDDNELDMISNLYYSLEEEEL